MKLQRTRSEQIAHSKVGKIRRTRKKELPRRKFIHSKKVGELDDESERAERKK